MSECADCPYHLWPCQCFADKVRHYRLCELAKEPERNATRESLYRRTVGIAITAKPSIVGENRAKIDACPHRGPIVVGGCSCTRLCWLGKGYNPQNLPYGQVKDLDCLTCVRSNE